MGEGPPTFTPSYIQLHLMRPSGITSWTQLLHCQYNYKRTPTNAPPQTHHHKRTPTNAYPQTHFHNCTRKIQSMQHRT